MAKMQKKTEKNSAGRKIRPSHTKGYYRFSKNFPSVTDSDGFRDNNLFVNSPAKKASVKRRLALLFVCVFAVTFVATLLCFAVSDVPVSEKESTSGNAGIENPINGMKAVYLGGDILSAGSAESIIGSLRVCGVDTVVIDFKNAAGNFYYKPSISVSDEALYKASDNAKKIVGDFQSAEIEVYARFACFADDIYARNNPKEALHIASADEEAEYAIWYNSGSDSHAWLNPSSSEVQYYLRVAAEDLLSFGVNGIIFDYVVLPQSAESVNIVAGELTASSDFINTEMTSFISLLNNVYISCRTAAVLTNEAALKAIADNAVPDIFLSGCDYIVVDSRLSMIPDNTVMGNLKYSVASASPYEFLTDYLARISEMAVGEEYSTEIIPLIETSADSEKVLSAVADSAADAYIMYDAEGIYMADNFNR